MNADVSNSDAIESTEATESTEAIASKQNRMNQENLDRENQNAHDARNREFDAEFNPSLNAPTSDQTTNKTASQKGTSSAGKDYTGTDNSSTVSDANGSPANAISHSGTHPVSDPLFKIDEKIDEKIDAVKPTEVLDQAKQHAQRVLQETQRTASETLGQARTKTTDWLEIQLDQAANGLQQVAQSVRKTGQQFQSQDPQGLGQLSQIANSTADTVEGVAGRLRDATVEEIYSDTQKLARTQPGLFIGGAFALGFLLARFLKSSGSAVSGQTGGTLHTSAINTPNTNSLNSAPVDRQLPVPIDPAPVEARP